MINARAKNLFGSTHRRDQLTQIGPHSIFALPTAVDGSAGSAQPDAHSQPMPSDDSKCDLPEEVSTQMLEQVGSMAEWIDCPNPWLHATDKMAARCGLPTSDSELIYGEGCTGALGRIIGSVRHDFLQECIELVEEALRNEDHSDERKWEFILRVMSVLRNLHRAPLCRPRRPPPLPIDVQIRNNDERPRERSRSPTTLRPRPHEPSSPPTATSFTCYGCGGAKNLKKRCRRLWGGAKWICSDCERPSEEAIDDNECYFTCFECNHFKLMRYSSTHKETQYVCTTCSASAPPSRWATEIPYTSIGSMRWLPVPLADFGHYHGLIEVD